MKKKITKTQYKSKQASRSKVPLTKKVSSTIHPGPTCTCAQCVRTYKGMWGTDRNLILLLAAGIIVLLVAGMYMAGWLR